MNVSVTLRNPIISRATRKRSITCASVTLRNVLLSQSSPSARRRSPPCITIVRDVGDPVRTQRSGGQPEYEPISPALYLYIPAAETLRKWRETCVVSQARPSRGEGPACETKTCAQHLDIRCARHSTAHAYL